MGVLDSFFEQFQHWSGQHTAVDFAFCFVVACVALHTLCMQNNVFWQIRKRNKKKRTNDKIILSVYFSLCFKASSSLLLVSFSLAYLQRHHRCRENSCQLVRLASVKITFTSRGVPIWQMVLIIKGHTHPPPSSHAYEMS